MSIWALLAHIQPAVRQDLQVFFLQSCFLSNWPSACTFAWCELIPNARVFICLFWTSWGSSQTILCWSSSDWELFSSQFNIDCKLPKDVPHLRDQLNKISGPNINPSGTLLVTTTSLTSFHWSQPLEQWYNQSFTYIIIHLHSPSFTSFVIVMIWKSVSKSLLDSS